MKNKKQKLYDELIDLINRVDDTELQEDIIEVLDELITEMLTNELTSKN